MGESGGLADRAGPFGLPSTVGLGGILAAGLLLLLPVLVVPGVDQPVLVPKIALLALVVGPGLVLLGELAWRGDRAAQLGTAVVVWAMVSATLSAAPRQSWLGDYGADRGAAYLAAYVGCWAIGRRLHPDARPLLAVAIAVTVGINVVLGVLQITADGDLGFLEPVGGRASGLTPSSVYLGALTAALTVLGAVVATGERSRAVLVGAVAAVVLGAAGTEMTGSRAGLAGAVLGTVAVVAWRRPAARRAAVILVALLVGLAAARLVPTDGPGASQRLDAASSSGVGARTEMWRIGTEAATERPLVGWGPGRFRAATSPETTATFARLEGPDKLYFDAHNVLVEHLTTVGVVGLGLLVGFGVLAARRARGPLAWVAAAIAVTWLLEPVSMVTAPVALMALGAAWTDPPGVEDPPPRPLASVALVAALAGVVGLAVGGAVLWAGTRVDTAVTTRDEAGLDDAERVFGADPVLADARTRIRAASLPEEPSPAQRAAVVAAAREATRRDPERPDLWYRLGVAELVHGDDRRAQEAFAVALERNPWSTTGLVGAQRAAELLGDDERAADAQARLCEIESPACEDGP